MSNIALTPKSGRPMKGDLVWSALPEAPVVDDSLRHSVRDLITFLERRRTRRDAAMVAPTRGLPPTAVPRRASL
jgi:hypothetical protein